MSELGGVHPGFSSAIKYRPEIDGLRAVAIIPVVLFHMGMEWLPGGFIGVDVFFVISGYLITSIILKDVEEGVFSLPQFWLRRIRRIMPALIVMVFAVSIVGCFILYAPDISRLGSQGIATLFSVANINFWLHAGSYWGADAKGSPLLHTWSLSVEEQFYLFFPFFILIVLTYLQRYLIPFLLCLSLASVLLFVYGTEHFPSASFYLLPTRAWELAAGCLLGAVFYKRHLKIQGSTFWSFIGIIAILLSYVYIDGGQGLSAFLILPVFGTFLVITYSKGDGNVVKRILSLYPVVYIGKISYSLYIWHWPILILLKNGFPNIDAEMLPLYSIPIILLVSVASYEWVEKLTRRNLKIIPYIAAAFSVAVAFSWYLSTTEFSENTSMYRATVWDGEVYNVAPIRELDSRRDEGITISKTDSIDEKAYAKGGIIKRYGNDKPEVVVLGDSHALMWARLLDEISKELKVSISFYAADGTPTFFDIPPLRGQKKPLFFSLDEKLVFDEMRMHYLKEWRPKVVIISARWSVQNFHQAKKVIEFIGDLGSSVLLVEDPPELFFGDKNAPQYLAHMNLVPKKNGNQFIHGEDNILYDQGRSLIRKLSNAYPYCDFVSTADVFLKGENVWVIENADVLYIDDDHLSRAGALKMKSQIKNKLKKYFK